ncbi:MAG TPA: PEGA domain-containing protein, partial [Myxococcales bacterium]|nr:PEGA domain-containing protein [Myxococcales bacterium]
NWKTALELWEAAESLNPDWRFAFNQAAIHTLSKQWKKTWYAIDRAMGYGLPAARLQTSQKIMEKAEGHLFKEHALIELIISPDHAVAKLDGKPWETPFKQWTKTLSSEIIVARDGFATLKQKFKHARRQRHTFVISLTPQGEGNRLLIEGRPDGAEVTLDGVVVGKLPQVDKRHLKPGPHKVHVEHEDYVSVDKTVIVKNDQAQILNVDLLPNSPLVVLQAPSERTGNMMKWVTLGIGTVLLAAASGTHVAALQVANDANAIAESSVAGTATDEDRAQYNNDVDKMKTLRLTTYVLYGLSGAALTTGVILVWLDKESPVVPTVISGSGMGVSWHGTF